MIILRTCYVLIWQYRDGSGSGAVAAYDSKELADSTQQLLESIGDPAKTYEVDQVMFHPDAASRTSGVVADFLRKANSAA